MSLFKRLFDFYLDSSIQTALSCYALVRMTQHMFQIEDSQHMPYFAFFGTIVGYNFVKYDDVFRFIPQLCDLINVVPKTERTNRAVDVLKFSSVTVSKII